MSSFLKTLRKKTGSSSFSDSKYAKIDHYIDTGCPSLNRIISGSVYNGIPSGKHIILAGETGTLKTIQALRIAANALNKNEYDAVLYFDSEGGAPYETLKNMDCDTDKVEHILIENIEDATVKILGSYIDIEKYQEKNPDFKALLIVDSIGALNASKLMVDVEKKRQVVDQGNRARLLNAMVKGCAIPSMKTNCSIIFINHIYEGPTMFTQKIKDQPGGKGFQYMGSLNIQCTKVLQKSEEEGFYGGSLMKFFTVKNRMIIPFLEAQAYVDFEEGFEKFKYLGLFDIAIELGFIEVPTQGYYVVPSYKPNPEKKFRKNAIIDGDESDAIWDSFLKEFDAASMDKLKYSKIDSDSLTEIGLSDEEAKDVLEEMNDDVEETED
jgi:RecA/RadA recombinase